MSRHALSIRRYRRVVITALLIGTLAPKLGLGDQPSVDQLLRSLKSNSYQTRALASERLLGIAETDSSAARNLDGQLAKPVADGEELEYRLALIRLKQTIELRRAKRFRAKFLYEPLSTTERPIGWDQFRQFAGEDFDARLTFVKITDSDHRFGARLVSPDQVEWPDEVPCRLGQMEFVHWCSLLAQQSSRSIQLSDRWTMSIAVLLRSEGQGPLLTRDYEKVVFARLVESYLNEAPVDLQDRICIGMRYGCHRMVESDCQLVLADPEQSPARIAVALLAYSALCENGFTSESRLLTQWLDQYANDNRVAYVWRSTTPVQKVIRTQVRDITFALRVHRQGLNPRSLGLESIQAHRRLIYQPYTVGFESEADRLAVYESIE